jgi:hypothetical protein
VTFFSGTQTELLYAYFGAGTASVPTVSPGSSVINGYPAIPIPGGALSRVGTNSSSLVFDCGGLVIATATVPTWQIFFYLTSVTPAAWGSTVTLGSTATFTPTATTGAWFTMRINIGLRTMGTVAAGGTSATSTVVCIGEMRSTLTAHSTQTVDTIPVSPATTYTPTLTAWEPDLQYFLWPSLSLGAATAGNTITMEYAKLYGEN